MTVFVFPSTVVHLQEECLVELATALFLQAFQSPLEDLDGEVGVVGYIFRGMGVGCPWTIATIRWYRRRTAESFLVSSGKCGRPWPMFSHLVDTSLKQTKKKEEEEKVPIDRDGEVLVGIKDR